MIRQPPRSTQSRSSAASDVYKRQPFGVKPTDVKGAVMNSCTQDKRRVREDDVYEGPEAVKWLKLTTTENESDHYTIFQNRTEQKSPFDNSFIPSQVYSKRVNVPIE
eukprot:TRINITY_DN16638_c0_g1_i1.p1 TRINITY_DN16638_c0_g1~~TRINITY_DN16638_c0_g1_i1.p1  ORF type:complete len:107 (-),score=28.89 TRINITY_DN16638_c0_g1_i1:58-378(-)